MIKRPRARTVPVKKAGASATTKKDVKVKLEPPSPAKKAVKRGFDETIPDIESESDNDVVEQSPSIASSSRTLLPVPTVEVPTVRRSNRKPVKGSKKPRRMSDPMEELHDSLRTQFKIVGDAFHAIGEAFDIFAKRDD